MSLSFKALDDGGETFQSSMFRGGNLVAFRGISCAIICRICRRFHLHPRVSRAFSPSEIRGRGKNPEESRSWNILPRSAWVRLLGTGIRFVWRRWTARRRRRSVEPLVQPYNSVNFIELPSPFLCPRNVLIFVPPSYFLFSGTFLSKWPDPTPEIRKKIGSAKNSRRFFV